MKYNCRNEEFDSEIMAIFSNEKLTTVKILQRYNKGCNAYNVFDTRHVSYLKSPSIETIKFQVSKITRNKCNVRKNRGI